MNAWVRLSSSEAGKTFCAGVGAFGILLWMLTGIATAQIQETKLVPSTSYTLQWYGAPAAMKGGVAGIGSTAVQESQDPFPGARIYGTLFIWEKGIAGWQQTGQIIPSGEDGNWHGTVNSVATDGTVIAAGITLDAYSGSVYLIDKRDGGWAQRVRIPSPEQDIGAPTFYGTSVGINGNWLAVGAPNDSEGGVGAGAVFVYEKQPNGEWWNRAKLLGHIENAVPISLGQTVAISGDRIASACGKYCPIFGDPYYQDEYTVAVFVYDYVGGQWRKTATIVPTDPAANTYYSSSFSLDGDTLAIGGYVYSPATGVVRTVFVFENVSGAWQLKAKLQKPEYSSNIVFGEDLWVTGDRIYVADRLAAGVEAGAGAVYVYRKEFGMWRYKTRLYASDGKTDDYFGWRAVAADGESVVVGANHAYTGEGNPPTTRPGAAYAYGVVLPTPMLLPRAFLAR